MSRKAQAMIDELIAACIAFGRQFEPCWQTLIEKARRELREYIDELEAERRWIPVSERLPKESGWYRVGAINVFYEGYTDEVYFDANKTKSGWHTCIRDQIYCWLDGVPELPLPQLPGERER